MKSKKQTEEKLEGLKKELVKLSDNSLFYRKHLTNCIEMLEWVLK